MWGPCLVGHVCPAAACAMGWPVADTCAAVSHSTSLHCFPCPCPQYHIVILPTFRDEHAELVQYLLQLPRLQRQRFFLTQHNPGAEGWGGAGERGFA